MLGHSVVPPRLGIEFPEQAMRGEQSQWLAWCGRVREGAFGVNVCLRCVTGKPVIQRPECLPFRKAEHELAVCEHCIMCREPCTRSREIARIEREVGSQAQRGRMEPEM